MGVTKSCEMEDEIINRSCSMLDKVLSSTCRFGSSEVGRDVPTGQRPWTSTAYPRASSQRTNNGTEWKSAGLDGMLYAQGDGGQGLRELDLSVNAEPSDIGWQGVSGAYDAVRCPEPGTLPGSPSVRDKVLMLCPFHEDYTKHWYYVSDKVAIEAAKSLVRMIDIASPQLVGQALYEHIRWTP
jgi:hypothetical protein